MTDRDSTYRKALGIVKKGDIKGIFVSHLTVMQSITILVFKLILIDIITAAIFLVFHSILFSTDVSKGLNIDPNVYNTLVFLVLIAGKIILTVFLVFEWLNEYYEIKPNEIIYRRGILFRRVTKQDLALVRALKVERGFLATFLNYGTINLYDIRLNRDIRLYMIHNPLKYLRILESIIPDLEEEKQFFARERALESAEED